MRYSKNFDRDWNFYLSNKDKFTFCGSILPKPKEASNGVTAKKAFFQLDSTGDYSPTCEPQLLFEILRTKKAINLQIKEWGIGQPDVCLTIDGMLGEFIAPPSWVESAIRNQCVKGFRSAKDSLITLALKEAEEAYNASI